MFDKFGEFDSYQEINELAMNLFNEGDTNSIRTMAKENGLPADFADMYITGAIPELCDAFTAAEGKLNIEAAELKPKNIMEDWLEYIKATCADNDQMAAAVRKKGKTLKGCIGALLKWSFGHQQNVDKDIVKAAGIKHSGKITLGIPGMGQAKKIIREYYLGGKA